jgi:pyruvate dehydrogenase E2 component (dihydrolipoamide acetyltransferase)
MSTDKEVRVPDIGGFEDVEIIDVLVAPGDAVKPEDPLITLESDKATMDVPAPDAGIVQDLKVHVGDKVSEGVLILTLTEAPVAQAKDESRSEPTPAPASQPVIETAPSLPPEASTGTPSNSNQAVEEVRVPDIGGFENVPGIEVLVATGAHVAKEDPLITLESDKATMDVPAPQSGTVTGLHVAVGDAVSEGSLIISLAPDAPGMSAVAPKGQAAAPAKEPSTEVGTETAPAAEPKTPPPVAKPAHLPPPSLPPPVEKAGGALPHASPSVRFMARELGVELSRIRGSGPKGRILKSDVQGFIKSELGKAKESGAGLAVPAMPEINFSEFGTIDTQDLPRIKKISGAHLHRAWMTIPHVTHHEEADVTEMEEFRKSLKEDAAKQGVRVTGLLFLMKALVAALREFPLFNSSLTSDGQRLVFKKYFHIGIATDTPRGLLVPVVRDVDKKGIWELAAEMGEISARAREGKLGLDELRGGCMSISNLGGIGGTAFTPIVNAPEVAILGITRARVQPVWDGEEFLPRLMMPLDLSYDHRVIDGAEAARFSAFLCEVLADVRRMLL